ncbi:MAG: hypothetical protein M3R38_11735 [Actinomycetota bacterium]|nr:hypothetical protein [Actinomycetota bacterium]
MGSTLGARPWIGFAALKDAIFGREPERAAPPSDSVQEPAPVSLGDRQAMKYAKLGWPVPEGYVTSGAVAEATGYGKQTILDKIRSGKLRAIKDPAPYGKGQFRYLCPAEEVDRMRDEKRAADWRREEGRLLASLPPNKLVPYWPVKPDEPRAAPEREVLSEMLALFEKLRDADPGKVAAMVPTKKGARDIHRDFWPVLAWLSVFFEDLNTRKKDRQLALGEGDEA